MAPTVDVPASGPRVVGAGGVEIATWDMGGAGSPVLLTHGTGLHAWTWLAAARTLAVGHRVWALDLRGHGTSGHTPGGDHGDWRLFAGDVLAVVDALELDGPAAVGHSLGAATLMMAEQARPGTFSSLWCYEPVVIPPDVAHTMGDASPLVVAARRRRRRFASAEAAVDNFRSKPPFDAFAPEVLDAYVAHGFASGSDGSVSLRLAPEEEASVYLGAAGAGVWERLGQLDLPVTLAGSAAGAAGPAALLDRVGAAVAGATTVRFDGLSHFGPMEDPQRVAAAVTASLGGSAAGVPPPH